MNLKRPTMRIPLLDKKNKISFSSFLKWYIIEGKKGKIVEAREEVQRRFPILDKNAQKIIIQVFLTRGKEERMWGYQQAYDNWDNTFMTKVKELFEKYHESGCDFLVIKYFPKDYIIEHMDELSCCYIDLCCRLIDDHVDFEPDWKKLSILSPIDCLTIMKFVGRKIEDSEANDLLYGVVLHLVGTTTFLDHDIINHIKEKGKPTVPSDLEYISIIINLLIDMGCNQVVNKFYEWEKELYSTILNSDAFKKLTEKKDCSKIEISNITKKFIYRLLPERYKSPTDCILDWLEDDSSYAEKMKEINPCVTLLIDKLGLTTTDH